MSKQEQIEKILNEASKGICVEVGDETQDVPEKEDTTSTILPDEIYEQEFKPIYKTVENCRQQLEDQLITALMSVMKEGKPDQKLKASTATIELLGLKEDFIKHLTQDTKNVQINIDKKPEISRALMSSLSGIGNVVEGSANKIKTQKGGKGA